jgi:hypothetical protein
MKPVLHTQAVEETEALGDCEFAGQAVHVAKRDPDVQYVFGSQDIAYTMSSVFGTIKISCVEILTPCACNAELIVDSDSKL